MTKILKSIRFRLLVWVLVICFLAGMGQTLVSYISARNILIDEIQAQCESLAAATASQVNIYLERYRDELSELTGAGYLQEMNETELASFLASIKSEDYDSFYVIWPDGQAVTDTGEKVNLSDREYFQQAMQGKPVISTLVKSKATGNLVAPVAVPIKAEGQIAGVLGASIKTEKLVGIVNSVKVGETGAAYMIDQKGMCIAHPNQEYILKLNQLELGEEMGAIGKKMIAGQTGIDQYMWEGQQKYMAYAPVANAGWSVAVNVPVKEVSKPLSSMLNRLLMVAVIVLGILVVFMWIVSGRFVQPILRMVGITERLANRDLTQQIHSQDESEIGMLMKSFGTMNQSLRDIMEQISHSSASIAAVSETLLDSASQTGSASEQVSASAEQVARAAASQAEDTQKTNELAEQVSEMMRGVGATTELMSRQSNDFQNKVERVTQLMTAQKSKMDSTVQSAGNVSRVISELNEKTVQIGEIITVINSIAEQTNLLALNAAIEAARAGDAGRGFAVVAEEVRKLAEETGASTLNIAAIVKEVQAQVERVVTEVSQVEKLVGNQGQSLEEGLSAFKDIEVGAGEMNRSIEDITATFEEVLASVEEMVSAIENISAVTEESAAAAEEVTAIAQSQLGSVHNIVGIGQQLNELSNQLKTVIASFKMS